MKKTTSILWIVTMLFISMFIYVSSFDTQTTKEGIDFLKFFIAFFAFVSVILTIFDNIEARRTIRFSQRKGFYSIALLVLISFSSCSDKNKQELNEHKNNLETAENFILNQNSFEEAEIIFNPDPMMKTLYREMQTSKNVLLREFYDEGGFQVVFVESGKRYTIYCSENLQDNLNKSVMSFWVRPNGTSSEEKMITFCDDNFDAKVNFGITGKGDLSFFDMKSLSEKKGI